jgi:hypothetical protein
MIFKLFALVSAAIPIYLFLRSVFFRRTTPMSEGLKKFRKQADLAVSILLILIGSVVLIALGNLVWAWLPSHLQ